MFLPDVGFPHPGKQLELFSLNWNEQIWCHHTAGHVGVCVSIYVGICRVCVCVCDSKTLDHPQPAVPIGTKAYKSYRMSIFENEKPLRLWRVLTKIANRVCVCVCVCVCVELRAVTEGR